MASSLYTSCMVTPSTHASLLPYDSLSACLTTTAALPPQGPFAVAEAQLEAALKARASSLRPGLVNAFLGVRQRFIAQVLAGQTPPNDEAPASQLVAEYVALLKELYPGLVLEPHVLPISLLEQEQQAQRERERQQGRESGAASDAAMAGSAPLFAGADGRVGLVRLLQRRFIVWQQARQEGQQQQSQQSQQSQQPQQQQPQHKSQERQQKQQQQQQKQQKLRGQQHNQQPVEAMSQQPPRQPKWRRQQQQQQQPVAPSTWAAGMQDVWARAKHVMLDGNTEPSSSGGLRYSEVVPGATADSRLDCSILDTGWAAGARTIAQVAADEKLTEVLSSCADGNESRRLYVTDLSMPDYEERGLPRDIPGLCCAVDAASNAMLPEAMHSGRAASALHFMAVESTGVASWVAYAALKPPVLTAFHLETKQRRSYNLGSDDLIVQPLATADSYVRLAQVHERVTGAHSRHGQLLPLEHYLEAGIALVVHIRGSQAEPELVELPECSCHAFVTFAPRADQALASPTIKVSCNDWCLVEELSSAFFLERLAITHGALAAQQAATGCSDSNDSCSGHKDNSTGDLAGMKHQGLAADGADTWVTSSLFCVEPCTLAQQGSGSWRCPWAEELASAPATAGGGAPGSADAAPAAVADAPAGPSAAAAATATLAVSTPAPPATSKLPLAPAAATGTKRGAAAMGASGALNNGTRSKRRRASPTPSSQSPVDGLHLPCCCEASSQDGSGWSCDASEDLQEDATGCWCMDTIVVRAAQRLLDASAGRLQGACYSGQLPDASTARRALARLLPALVALWHECQTEAVMTGGLAGNGNGHGVNGGSAAAPAAAAAGGPTADVDGEPDAATAEHSNSSDNHTGVPHFSKEYVASIICHVAVVLPTAAAAQLPSCLHGSSSSRTNGQGSQQGGACMLQQRLLYVLAGAGGSPDEQQTQTGGSGSNGSSVQNLLGAFGLGPLRQLLPHTSNVDSSWPPWRVLKPAQARQQLLEAGRDLRELWLVSLHCQWVALQKAGKGRLESMSATARLRAGVEAACDAWASDACRLAAATCQAGAAADATSLGWPAIAVPRGALVDDSTLFAIAALPPS